MSKKNGKTNKTKTEEPKKKPLPLISRQNVQRLSGSVNLNQVLEIAKGIVATVQKIRADNPDADPAQLPSTYIREADAKAVYGHSMRTIHRYKAELNAKGWTISQSSVPKTMQGAGTILFHIVPKGWRE